jgi:hypothetical protein
MTDRKFPLDELRESLTKLNSDNPEIKKVIENDF